MKKLVKRLVRLFLSLSPYWENHMWMGIWWLIVSGITISGAWRQLSEYRWYFIAIGLGVFIGVIAILFILSAIYICHWDRREAHRR